jgi:hypothetical protein
MMGSEFRILTLGFELTDLEIGVKVLGSKMQGKAQSPCPEDQMSARRAQARSWCPPPRSVRKGNVAANSPLIGVGL